jgi:3-hydroxyisobutyrate dehydrogenase-like beta-hydroxyacid dehydrogenase
VTVWNRSAAKAGPLVEAGALLAASPKAAATGCEVLITMVADDAALDGVMSGDAGVFAGLPAGGLHISMSTIAVGTARDLTAAHAERAQRFLCAPVFGRPEAAAAAKLFVVAAGKGSDVELANPFFGAVSQRVFYVGEVPASASLIKLCGNFMILAAIEAMGEAMALAEKGGVPKRQLVEVLTGTLFDSPVYRIYGALLAENRFRPAGFAAPLGLKDMRLTAQSAQALRVPMPLLHILSDHLLQTIAVEGEDMDWSGIARSISRNAGL